jgi:glycosyltransferase involved in cell wall biosynthesis
MWSAAGRPAERYDLVHATAFPYAWPVVCGLRLARRLGIPFLLTPFLHLGDPANPTDPTRRQYTAPPLRWLLRSADRVLVQTDAELDAVCDLGVPPDRIVRQGLGVDIAACSGGNRRCARASWNITGETVVIGHLANNSAEKGTIDLLRAAERLWRLGTDFAIVLAGPEMPNFRRFFVGYPFANRVRRLGVLNEDHKRDFFAGLDVFALPSRSDSFGLVLLEAWANELPNIVYRAGGPAELVIHERDGLQASCGDVTALAQQLGRLIADSEVRRRLGVAGRQRVEREFNWNDKLQLVHEEMKVVGEASRKRCATLPRSLAKGITS